MVFIKDFRPISMCNVTYKVITKLIAQRIRSIVSKLVVALFLLHTRDNIVVAQEIFYSMRSMKGSEGWMTIKIDLEKSYDRLK